MPPHDVSIVVLFNHDRSQDLLTRLLAIERQVSGTTGCEVIVVGHGKAEDSSCVARLLVGAIPTLRVLLHARPCHADEALVAGVEFARTRWVVVPAGRAGCRPVLFERHRFLALHPWVRWLRMRWVAVLCRLSGPPPVPAPRVVP